MAFYVLGYLYTTQDLPLVLGTSSVSIRSNTNASLATGPLCCNILGSIVTLVLVSGTVHAKATTTSGSICLFTFKAELDGLMTVSKLVIHIRHMLQELVPDFTTKGVIFSYNEALVNLLNGNGPMVKGVRHFEIHQWLYS